MTRVFKPDSGHTLEIRDEGGSAALTIDTDGDIQIANNITTGTIGGSVTFPADHIIKTEYSTQQEQSPIESSANWFAQTLSNYVTGDKCLITVCGYAMMGVADSTNYFDVYLSSTNATSGIGQDAAGEPILAQIGRYGTLWDKHYYSYTFLTGAVSTSAPVYSLYTSETGISAIYLTARFTFQHVQG